MPPTFDESYFRGGDYTFYDETVRDFPADAQKYLERGLTGSVLIVGCAIGYTVQRLRALGVNAWGMDTSAWAIQNSVVPSFVRQGDVRVAADVSGMRTFAGVGRWFDAIVDEDVLTCLSDADAITACTNMRNNAKSYVVHRLSVHPIIGEYNIKSLAQWRALTDSSKDYWFVYQSWVQG